MFINGYKFETSSEAQSQVDRVNNYYGIPKSADDVTKNWTSYEFADLNSPTFYYIIADETLIPVLGYPSPMDVVFSEETP
jgi:hypothetical protein